MMPPGSQLLTNRTSACPLTWNRNGKPEFFATATLLSIASERFLITAAHATDEFEDQEIRIPTLGGWVVLEGDWIVTTDPNPFVPKRKTDRTDLAIFHLAPHCAVALEGLFQFAPEHQLCCWDSLCTPELYHFCGYPSGLVQKENDRNLSPILFTYESPLASKDIYSKLELERNRHIVVRFNHRKVSFLDGKKRAVAHPGGMSGGPIWTVRNSKQPPTFHKAMWIAGIIIEHSSPHFALVGVRIEGALAALAQWKPQVAAALPDTRLLNIGCEIRELPRSN